MSMEPEQTERENYQEFIIRAVLVFMWGVVLVFTPIVLIVMFAGEPFVPFPTGDVLIIVLLNVFSGLAVYFAGKGYWKTFAHLVPLLLLFLGDYGIWFHGIRTSFLLFFGLIAVLAGMFHTYKHQVFLNIFMILNIVGIMLYRGDTWDDSITSLVVTIALLVSISLLQKFSSSLVWQFITYNQTLASELHEENLLRKEREKQIEQMNEALGDEVRQRTSQLEDKHKEMADLSYTLAHDLRAPLRAMIGFNQIIEHDSRGKLGAEALDLLNRSIKAGWRMDRIIDSILSLAQIGQNQLKYQEFNLAEMVYAVFMDLQRSNSLEKVEFVIQECPDVNADKELALILVKNLVMNAIKFSGDQEHPQIEFGCHSKEGERAIFYLKDNGVGFSMDYAEKIFEPFHRLDKEISPEGLGIGLSIAKRVVERHGGVIWAESVPGEETLFYFSL